MSTGRVKVFMTDRTSNTMEEVLDNTGKDCDFVLKKKGHISENTVTTFLLVVLHNHGS